MRPSKSGYGWMKFQIHKEGRYFWLLMIDDNHKVFGTAKRTRSLKEIEGYLETIRRNAATAHLEVFGIHPRVTVRDNRASD